MDVELQKQLLAMYPHLGSQLTPAQPQALQPTLPTVEEQQAIQERVEHYKIRVSEMLRDWYAEDYKTIAGNNLVDELKLTLGMPLGIQDRIYLTDELNKLIKPAEHEKSPSNVRSAEEIVNQSKPEVLLDGEPLTQENKNYNKKHKK